MLFLLFCKTLLVRLRRHTCSNFYNDTKTLLYLTFVRSHLNMIMLVRSGVLSQLEIFRKMRVSEKDLSNQIYFELAWMGRIPPQYHENLTKLGFQAPGFQLFLIVDYVHEINDLLFYFRCQLELIRTLQYLPLEFSVQLFKRNISSFTRLISVLVDLPQLTCLAS